MSVIIPIKNPLKIKNNTICSFCGEKRPCVESLISNKTICYLCHQNAKEILNELPTGAIQCLCCNKHNNIVVEMDNKSLITYNSPGLDIQHITLYTPVKFSGMFKEGVGRHSAWCGHCKNEIPLYILNRNPYIL